MKICDSTVFGKMRRGRYPHQIALEHQYELELAAIMAHYVQDLNWCIAKCIHERFNRIPEESGKQAIDRVMKMRADEE